MTGVAARSLQGRIAALVLGAVTLVWAVASVATWFDVRHELDELLDAHLAQAASLLVVQQVGEPAHEDDRVLDAPSLHRYAPRAMFQVFHEGALALRSADAPDRPLVPLADGAHGGFRTADHDGRAWRVFVARDAAHEVDVVVAERLDARRAILRAAMLGTLWPMAVALPLLGALVWWSVRRGLAPLRSLGAQLTGRDAQALAPVAVPGAPSELVPLVAALNGLFGRIEALLASERRFTADAAHELRTPIAVIRAQAQVAMGAGDDAGRRAALQATLAGCDRAARLVDQMLTLARLEAGATLDLRPVDLAAVARTVVADLAPVALDRDQELGVDAPAPAVVVTDAALAAVLLRNLVDNAVRHTPAGTRIDVAVEGAPGSGATIHVEDAGPGLADEALAALGQRFRRPAGQAGAGSGLGWSIVERIARVQGLRVARDRSPGLGGLRVQVVWPASPAPVATRADP